VTNRTEIVFREERTEERGEEARDGITRRPAQVIQFVVGKKAVIGAPVEQDKGGGDRASDK
jgi:hypothetical protein